MPCHLDATLWNYTHSDDDDDDDDDGEESCDDAVHSATDSDGRSEYCLTCVVFNCLLILISL
jgi:hypothetical protein